MTTEQAAELILVLRDRALLDELEALRAVLETGEPLGGYSTDQRIDIQVDRAAWQAWQARGKP